MSDILIGQEHRHLKHQNKTTMSNQKRTIKEFKVKGTENQVVRLSLNYNKGGMNYFTYANERRGFYLSASPLTINKRDGWTSEEYVGFSGSKLFVEELKRFSQKKLDSFEPTQEQVELLLNTVTKRNEIEIEF